MPNPLVIVVAFAIVLIAELPDKSMFASLVLGTRFAARWVFLGVAAAFLVHVVIAVAAGSALDLLPTRVVHLIVAGLFLAGAALMLLAARGGDEDVSEPSAARSPRAVTATSFGIVFVGEWGDVTQLATANLAARYHDPVAVGIGAVLGLWTAALLAITLGRTLLRYLPVRALHLIGAAVFVGFAAWSLVEALG